MDVRVPKGLFKRGKGYAVRVAVPNEYQAIIGKKEIVRGLGTQDLAEALVRRKEVLQEILASIGEPTATGTDFSTAAKLMKEHKVQPIDPRVPATSYASQLLDAELDFPIKVEA